MIVKKQARRWGHDSEKSQIDGGERIEIAVFRDQEPEYFDLYKMFPELAKQRHEAIRSFFKSIKNE